MFLVNREGKKLGADSLKLFFKRRQRQRNFADFSERKEEGEDGDEVVGPASFFLRFMDLVMIL